MAPALDVDVIRSSVLATVIILVSDRIPNIRFNVAKALEVLAASLAGQAGGQELVTEGILPSLEKLRADSDADVRFFAEKATLTAQAVASGETQAITTEVVMADA